MLLPAIAHAVDSGVDAYEEYGKRIHAAQQVEPLKDSLFGDKVSLYNGATSFSATDIAIPGNDALPVALSRQLAIQDLRGATVGAQLPNGDALPGFADWSLDIPYVEGTFTQANGWTLNAATPGSTSRCSDNTDEPYTLVAIPGGYGFAPYGQIWHGTQLHVPGAGSQVLLANDQPKSYAYTNGAYANGGGWKWVTAGNWKLRCTSTVSGMAGEGFVALSPAGVTYTFNYAVTRQSSRYAFHYNVKKGLTIDVPRVRIYLLVTQIKDRFNNTVDYTYNGDHGDGVQLSSISSSDGRSISLNWSGGVITSVTSALGTWHYYYANRRWVNQNGVTFAWPYLSSVTRPDGSQWRYTINAGAMITNKNAWPDREPINDPGTHCQNQNEPLANSGSFNYTVTAPSNASATYDFEYARHYRSRVPQGCAPDSNPLHDYPQDATDFSDNFSLASKIVSGPGLARATWTYDYGDGKGQVGSYYTATAPWSGIATAEPYLPPGDCANCAVSKVVTVTGPANIVKSTYGVQYARNEGQLLQEQVTDLSGVPLKTTTYTFVSDAQAPGEPFPDIAGYDLRPAYQDPMGNRNRPVATTVINQDGVNFSTAITAFDVLARATATAESGTASRSTVTAYADNQWWWTLGQPGSQSVNGIEVSHTYYNPSALPVQVQQFGKVVSSKTWNGDGTLATIADGKGNVTALSNWKRGIPQSVTYAVGSSVQAGEQAEVSDAGLITSITDEAGGTTGYGYDAMGRLSEIDYPNGPNESWSATKLSFNQVNGIEFGIPAGHWTQTIQTGSGCTRTFFDAFWRPLVYASYTDCVNNQHVSQVVHLYDAAGRTVFTSYPTNTATSYTQTLPGTYSDYDALNRVTQQAQDSELGLLSTSTQYLNGFQTKVTDPRGNSTTTSYVAYGSPDTSQPYEIDAPEQQTTTISRDAFGKPTWISRNGVTYQAFIYDSHQRLCKLIAQGQVTGYGYDDAGNLAWSADGMEGYGGAGTGCSVTAANAGAHLVTRTYDKRNRLSTLSFSDGNGNQSWTYTADGLPETIATTNLTAAGAVTVTNSYLYDPRRLLTAEGLTVPGQFTWVVGYGYDANGHLAVRYTPSQQYYITNPDALGQPTMLGIRNVNQYVYSVNHYPDGHIASFRWTNGVTHDVSENVRGLTREIQDSAAGNVSIDLVYGYDANGNPTTIQDIGGQGARSTVAIYDRLDRLYQASIGGYAGGATTTYNYDALGRTRSTQVGTQERDYHYGTYYPDRLASVTEGASAISYGYDQQGNLASRNGVPYQFDYGNRLRAVGGLEGGYLYDGHGRRVAQTDATGTIDSFYDHAGQLVFQRDREGGTHDYLYLGGKLVAIRDYDTQGIARVMRYQHTDALGSIIRQTDKNGAEVAGSAVVYDAWGGIHATVPQDGPGYTGHVQDADTGLVYMQQRYYDPDVGRFLSVDPVGADAKTGGNLDRYWYANDNPYRYTDPFGAAATQAAGRMADAGNKCTGSHIGGGACGSLNLRRFQVGAPSAPTSKIAHDMVSNNPADRVSAAYAAMDYFGIKPAKGTVKLDIKYNSQYPSWVYGNTDQIEPGVGLVTLGPAAYKTWAHLGSTLGHEIEVHWNRQLLLLGNYGSSKEHDSREMEAYKYNIQSAARFGNSESDIMEFKDMYKRFENDYLHGPDTIDAQFN